MTLTFYNFFNAFYNVIYSILNESEILIYFKILIFLNYLFVYNICVLINKYSIIELKHYKQTFR